MVVRDFSFEDPLKTFQVVTTELFITTADIIRGKMSGYFDGYSLDTLVNLAVLEVVLAYTALQIEVPQSVENLWEDTTLPSIDMICAKLVRYSSNLYAVAFAYPETALESNMDYDLKQYLMFLHAYYTLKKQ